MREIKRNKRRNKIADRVFLSKRYGFDSRGSRLHPKGTYTRILRMRITEARHWSNDEDGIDDEPTETFDLLGEDDPTEEQC